MGGLLSKKSKVEGKATQMKEPKEESLVKTIVEQVLYVQLEAF